MKRLIKNNKQFLNSVYSFLKNKNQILKFASIESNPEEISDILNAVTDEFKHNEPEYLSNLKDQIIQESQSNFSGTVYRKIELSKNNFSNLEVIYDSNEDQDKKNGYYNIEDVMRVIRKNIATSLVQSCTSSLDACKNFEFYSGISIIIYFNTSDGLDVIKACEYYKEYSLELYNQSGDQFYNNLANNFDALITTFADEQEILARVPKGYSIYSINDVEVDNNSIITREQLGI